MAAGAGDRQTPRDQVPGNRPKEGRKQDRGSLSEDQVVLNDATACGWSLRRPENYRPHEIGRGREQDRVFRLEGSGCHRGRDGVRGVVEAVDVVEGYGQRKDGDQGKQSALRQARTTSR